jgi:peptidase E
VAVECLQKIDLINDLRIKIVYILGWQCINQFSSIDNCESVVSHTSNSFQKQAPFNETRQQLIQKFVREHKLIELKSEISRDQHIITLNNLPI